MVMYTVVKLETLEDVSVGWFKKFRARNSNLDDEPRSRRPPGLEDADIAVVAEAEPKLTAR